MIKPKKIEQGDKIMTLSLSRGGPWACARRYMAGKKQLEKKFQVKVVEWKYTCADPEWIYQHPEARAEDLMNAFENPEIKAIVSTIGGEEGIRILPYVDFNVIRNNPKVFLGYSDSTVIHFICQKAGINSFYGPSIMAGFAENWGLFPYMVDSIEKTLFSDEIIWEIVENKEWWTNEFLPWKEPENQKIKRKLSPSLWWNWLQGVGVIEWILTGGCIDVFPFLQGTSIWPSQEERENKVLCIETSEEKMSEVAFERIIRNLGSQGILQRLSAILLWRSQMDYKTWTQISYDRVLKKVIVGEFWLYDFPMITNMDFWHTDPMFTIPLGCKVRIDCENKKIFIVESACI